MIELSNIRIETVGEWTRLVSDITITGFKNPFNQSTMWFSVKNEYADMLSCDNYNAFFLIPLYLGMYYGSDVSIKGCISRKLYRNMMDYGQQILCNFSPDLKKINVFPDQLIIDDTCGDLIGTGISCGVDSLSTIHDRFACETDLAYRVNSLFFFNCGTHGHYELPETFDRFMARYALNKGAADMLGLPFYLVNSNLHAFTHKIAEQKLGYFAIYSCVLSLQKQIRKYYISSSYSYNEILENHNHSHDFDMAEFADSYLLPLIQTENLEFVLDGAQYLRSEKTENIMNWDVAQKYLNVCINPDHNGKNCSNCSKCMRTLIPIEAAGKLNLFKNVFDLETYHKFSHVQKVQLLAQYKKEGFATDVINYAKHHNMKLPNHTEVLWFKFKHFLKIFGRKLLGQNHYDRIKQILQGK